jgi:hypothetical protein
MWAKNGPKDGAASFVLLSPVDMELPVGVEALLPSQI